VRAYYNEHDPQAAAWLRELIKAGMIAEGDVDERSIEDVYPTDLVGYRQCHFFAGIGVWSYALRLAGWPDDEPVWTGSCPCQPFSAAGKRKGPADERHLWPAWHWLIKQCVPGVIFGEQVASKDGIAWLDTVSTDLEGEGYRVGPVVFPACGVGAPHIRQRLWFVADTNGGARRQERALHRGRDTRSDALEGAGPGGSGVSRILADTDGGDAGAEGLQRGGQYGLLTPNGVACELVYARSAGAGRDAGAVLEAQRETPVRAVDHGAIAPGPTNGAWVRAEWIYCRDEKWRPVEPGTQPLAHGAPARVGRLRGYGNAIVAQAAAQVIAAYREASA
jgi:DNA (cytosine-5)-methyltransferase 1